MSQPMIVWCVTVAVLLLAFLLRAVEKHYAGCRRNHAVRKPRHLFELGKEREMFYIPGDSDDDDFDD